MRCVLIMYKRFSLRRVWYLHPDLINTKLIKKRRGLSIGGMVVQRSGKLVLDVPSNVSILLWYNPSQSPILVTQAPIS